MFREILSYKRDHLQVFDYGVVDYPWHDSVFILDMAMQELITELVFPGFGEFEAIVVQEVIKLIVLHMCGLTVGIDQLVMLAIQLILGLDVLRLSLLVEIR